MFKNNRNLLIIALVAIVNALGYGIIIPVLYSYSQKFGLTDFQNGLLFAVFSAGQFLSTPIIGRMSDRFGRRPLLIASLIGTTLSFFLMAFAPNALFLFIARALDGITAGNIPVASAVISDTTDIKNRARGFGIIGASFGFGFVFGPAISALTVGISDKLPFIIAGLISLVAVTITAIVLPETNRHIGQVSHEPLFNFKKLFKSILDENIGLTLLITLIYFIAFGMFIFAFQPFATKILKLSANQISTIFTVFGIIGLLTQVFFVGRITKLWGVKRAFNIMLFLASLGFLGFFFTHSLWVFFIPIILLGFSNSSVGPLIQTILSEETDEKSQGMIQGLNSSYMSIGFIVGPILGGMLATFAIPYPFLAGSALILICFGLSFRVLHGKFKT